MLSWLLGAGIVLSGILVPTAAYGGPAALCEPGPCSIQSVQSSVNIAHVTVNVRGNPGADVVLQAYTIEFNSAGAVTGLVPASAPTRVGTTNAAGRLNAVRIAPDANLSPVGGHLLIWFEGAEVADVRNGLVLAFGGATLRLLGDGWAAQKPVGRELRMDVIGYVAAGMRYWVQYEDDGTWVDAPGQSYHDAQLLSGGEPSDRRQISYVIPPELTRGREYTFRINSHRNYSGSPDRPLTPQAFAEWTVIPSGNPQPKAKGRDFDPTLDPGERDVEPPLNPEPRPEPTASQQPAPRPKPTGKPRPGPGPGPAPSQRPDGPTGGAAGPGGPGVSPTPGRPAAPDPTSSPTPTADPTPTAAADPDGADRTEAGVVWGQEASASNPSSAALPASSSVSRAAMLIGALVLAGPMIWWVVTRRRDERDAGEPL